jgi:hypothetical protein
VYWGMSLRILHTRQSAVNGFACIIIEMYIIAIGWLYVTVLVALNEPSVVAGIISFLFYGLLPCGLLLWLGGSRMRRQRRRHRELLANQRPSDNDRGNTQPDQ